MSTGQGPANHQVRATDWLHDYCLNEEQVVFDQAGFSAANRSDELCEWNIWSDGEQSCLLAVVVLHDPVFQHMRPCIPHSKYVLAPNAAVREDVECSLIGTAQSRVRKAEFCRRGLAAPLCNCAR